MDLFRHGNWDAATEGVRWDPAIDSRDLPASLYLVKKPDWFGDLPWPVYGPDVEGLEGMLPAQVPLWGETLPPDPAPPPSTS